MRKRKPLPKNEVQISQYDKILQENIEEALPGLIKNVLHINVAESEELPDNLQHTKERKPDLLKKVVDDKGNTFILHIEFQTANDAGMPYRMLDYLALLLGIYRLPVEQYVIFIGEGKVTMPAVLTNGKSIFVYDLIALSSIDYKVFLQSSKPEEKMFAILGDFGKDDVLQAVARIVEEIDEAANGNLEKERRKNQVRMLAQLRTLVADILEAMQPVSSFFKVENDFLYKRGRRKTLIEVVKKMLDANRFTVSEIANFAGVTEDFVREVQKNDKQS